MNPKNILNLLHFAFKGPEFNIEFMITDKEWSFSSELADLIKTSSDCRLIIESYDTLCYNEDCVMKEAVVIDEEWDEEFDDSIQGEYSLSGDSVDLEYKQRTVAFWRSGKKRKRSIESVQA